MTIFRIQGGRPLRGKVTPAGNKNAVLPMIAAALLTDEPVVLENVPDIDDVRSMLRLADSLGVRVDRNTGKAILTMTAETIRTAELPPELCSELRAGILFAAPLLHRAGRASMSPPGGDVIGKRRLDTHFYGLSRMGTEIETGRKFVFTVDGRLQGTDLFLPEASVTGTAQLLLAAVIADGKTVIHNAAAEPHIQDLANLLNRMGGRISGAGTNLVTVDGVASLHGVCHRISSDYTEAGSLLALAAATGGQISVKGINPGHYRMIKRVFSRLGIDLKFSGDTVSIDPESPRHVENPLTGGMPTVDDGIWPQFPSDLMSATIVLATQLNGTVLFFEKMYESRMYFVDRLVAMGANAVICDPHRAVISGPCRLHGIVLSSPDIRAGMALVGAALCAEGQSIIKNVELIDRGYEKIELTLRSLGAEIERD